MDTLRDETYLLTTIEPPILHIRLLGDFRLKTGDEHLLAIEGYAMILKNRVGAGIYLLRQSIEGYRKQGPLGAPAMLAWLIHGHLMQDTIVEGYAAFAEAPAIVEQYEEHYHEAESHRLHGDLLLREGSVDQAETTYKKAIRIARDQEARFLELRAATSLAKLWQQQGRTIEARDVLMPVYSWFTEGFDLPELQIAWTLLEKLE